VGNLPEKQLVETKYCTISGMTALPGERAAMMFFIPKFAKSLMKGPAVLE
jgi:hypothetical protein